MTLKYSFTNSKGEKRVEVQKPFEMLSDISNCTTPHLNDTITKLEKVVSGEMDYWSWGGSDYCIIDSAELESMVFYEFGEKDTIVDTKELLKLLKEYGEFRKK
ncbi:MAG TPA: hypothetical protein VL947_04400 [Cytophagales bacterium]|nr:hypothetical protein [Cytophagales bacterium]